MYLNANVIKRWLEIIGGDSAVLILKTDILIMNKKWEQKK